LYVKALRIYPLLLCGLLAQLLAPICVSGKSDWIEDGSDNQSTRRPVNAPARQATDTDAAIPGTDNASPQPTADDTAAGKKNPGPNEPLQARVSRFDRPEAGTLRQGGVEENGSPAGGMPSFPVAAPGAPPRSIHVSSDNYRRWLTGTHKLSATLTAKDKGKIIEVQGSWDDASHALRTFGLPYTRIPANELATKPLSGVRAIVVDCGSRLPPGAENAIRQYVYTGGYLLTTDWALDSCLTECFPGYLEPDGNYSQASVVGAAIVTNSDPDLVKNVVSPSFWKLEKDSKFVRQVGPNVQVLAYGLGMLRQDPGGQGILAASFDYGRGHVLHLVGHFDTNSTGAFTNELVDPSPGIIISLRQALAANFIMRALADQ